ncbi:MFS transporter, partial [Acidianus sp. RZ1]|uniref:MFS transporter n=1 Tax=Acidianus sp. RZ1 TaxID=1540082 RepID=UPI001492C8E0
VIEKVTNSQVSTETKKLIMDAKLEEESSKYYKDLLTKYTKWAIFIGLFYFFFAIAFIDSTIYGPSILASFGESGLIGSILYWSLFVVGDIICILIIDSFGRRNSTITGWAGMLVTILFLTFAPPTFNVLKLLSFILFAMFQGIGPASLHMVYSPELFPTKIRATAEGWKQGIGRLGGVITGLIFPALPSFDELSIIIFACFAGLILSILLAPETKDKTLEEISERKIGGETIS